MLTTSIVLSAGQTVKFNDVGNFLRVLSASAGITVRTYKNGQVKTEAAGVFSGFAEQFEQDNAFESVEVYSATAQTVQLVIRYGSTVYYDQAPSGSVTVSNAVELGVTTLAALETIELGAATLAALENTTVTVSNTILNDAEILDTTGTTGFYSTTVLALNGVEQVISAAANINGVILNMADLQGSAAGATYGLVLLAKATTPTGAGDGIILPLVGANNQASGYVSKHAIPRRIKIQAGLGLYVFNSGSAETTARRWFNFKIL